MGLVKREYKDQETVITADNMNEIQDAVIALEDGLFTVDNTKSGEVITITDAYKRGFRGLSVYGKTTQDGTPTPDAPIELVSVGDSGSITVNVTGASGEQSMTLATPNGLPGIPVASGGNYTDENGQQWVCDEKDFARGVYIQRVWKYALAKYSSVGYKTLGTHIRASINFSEKYSIKTPNGLSNIFEMTGDYTADTAHFYVQNTQLWVFVPLDELTTADANGVIEWLTNKGAEFYYILATPIETPLSEEELAAYASLHTYRDNTTVSNDAGAYMELEYVMDAKKYIDSLVGSSMIHQATVE